jgi:murein DD-endopeptidase MepM/ murein hydrolase activator NlpD
MKKTLLLLVIIFASGYVIPDQHKMPVQGATSSDWNHQSFWYYPWGRNRVHKGIDIFATEGTPVVAPTGGFILFKGQLSRGGNVVYMMGSKWRFHYFAHLKSCNLKASGFIRAGDVLGTVGSTGNAQGKSAHLHYSIKSLFPRIWKYDSKGVSRWSRVFFLDPGKYILGES